MDEEGGKKHGGAVKLDHEKFNPAKKHRKQRKGGPARSAGADGGSNLDTKPSKGGDHGDMLASGLTRRTKIDRKSYKSYA